VKLNPLHSAMIALALLGGVATVSAQAPNKPTKHEVESAVAAIKKWRTFQGTWEGELRYDVAPKEEWKKQTQPIRVVIKDGMPKVYVRHGIRDWTEIGSTQHVSQPDELTIIIYVYGSAGVWTENNVVVLTRRTEDSGDVFIQRVVNNWAGKPLPNEDSVYGDTRSGSIRRQ
jgi:hypothetical protein